VEGYNFPSEMNPAQYALVVYVGGPLGAFVQQLRRELRPEHGHLPAHVTVLPPRPLSGSEEGVLDRLSELCSTVQPFSVDLGDVETFLPITPTVFLRIGRGAYRMRELHDLLNTTALACEEQWPYMPHLTIAKFPANQPAITGLEICRRRWADYRGPRDVRIEQLTFVRQSDAINWTDLAPLPLGRALAPAGR
jgi:hypothetical protein